MKKVTRANFEGLRQRCPVLNKEEMRHYVGGNFILYDENEWLLPNPHVADIEMVMDNSSAITNNEETEEIINDLWDRIWTWGFSLQGDMDITTAMANMAGIWTEENWME